MDKKAIKAQMAATKPHEWRPEEAPFDTAPQTAIVGLDPAGWGLTVEQAREMLSRRMCPACGEGPWQSPLNHASRKHGFDRFAMRDACGLTSLESVVAPDLSARFTERGKAIDMSLVNHKGKPRKKQRWTQAGLAKNAAHLAAWEAENPEEALRMRAEAGRLGGAARAAKRKS